MPPFATLGDSNDNEFRYPTDDDDHLEFPMLRREALNEGEEESVCVRKRCGTCCVCSSVLRNWLCAQGEEKRKCGRVKEKDLFVFLSFKCVWKEIVYVYLEKPSYKT